MSSDGEFLIDDVSDIIYNELSKAITKKYGEIDWQLSKSKWMDVWQVRNLPVNNETDIIGYFKDGDKIIGEATFTLIFNVEGDFERYIETEVDDANFELFDEPKEVKKWQ